MCDARWTVAVHEASHAVVGCELRHSVTLVTIVRNGIAVGRTIIPTIEDWEQMVGDSLDQRFMRKYKNRKRGSLAIYLAGDVGNHLDGQTRRPLVSARVPPHIIDGLIARGTFAPGFNEKDDVKRALSIALHCWDTLFDEIDCAEARARKILRVRWQRVLYLARKLIRQGEMKGAALEAALSFS